MEAAEVYELERWLQQESLSREASSSSERLVLLWRLYKKKEHKVRVLSQEIQDLRSEHSTEIKKVHRYVEKIRNISKSQESAAGELGRENEALRSKLAEFKLQQEAQKKELSQMLQKEGLQDIILSSASEQVAYFLAERAFLIDKLPEPVDFKTQSGFSSQTFSHLYKQTSHQVPVMQGQSSWKRLLGLRKATQSRQMFAFVATPPSKVDESKGQERCLLERDLDEASTRLNMAHKEIRRLTDELESARLSQRANEAEVETAHLEVEQLKKEVEELKHSDVELQKVQEINAILNVEVLHLRESVCGCQSKELDLPEKVTTELQCLQHRLQVHQTQSEQNEKLLVQKQEELNVLRVQINHMEKEIKDLQQLLCERETCKEPNAWFEDQVKDMILELSTLKVQAEKTEFHRKLLAEKEKELQQQVLFLQSTNTELSRTNAELIHKIQNLLSKDPDNLVQSIKKLEEQLSISQQEVKKIQTELQMTQFDLQFQIRKYHEKKSSHKEKLTEAKDLHLSEMQWRDQKIMEQERQLELHAKRIEKEKEMIKMVTAENEALLSSRMNLLCELSDAEEARNDASTALTALQKRVDFLEKIVIQQQDLNTVRPLRCTEDCEDQASKHTKLSKCRFETDILLTIQKTDAEELSLVASEMSYLNLSSMNAHKPSSPQTKSSPEAS